MAIASDQPSHKSRTLPRSRVWRLAFALSIVAAVSLCAAAAAGAYELQLVFPDGQPMTYGSACVGLGCLARGQGVDTTDEQGQVYLSNRSRTIEYRRDGIALAVTPPGVASGTVVAVGNHTTVVLPHMLVGSAPAVDAAESDLVARLNEARAAQGLPLAQINPRLSTAADMQATWLTQSAVTPAQFQLFHTGPFETDMAFRHGEVSLPDPGSGSEIAEAGATIDETVADWLSSAQHREAVLAPGEMLMGVARVGEFIIVQTHKPCAGCEAAGPGALAGGPPSLAPAPVPPPPPPSAPTVGSTEAPMASCGSEQLQTRRLNNRRGRVRLRVGVHCLRPGARYVLMIRQGTAGRLLKSIRIEHAKTMTLQLRPGSTVHRLRIRLKRDGQVIFGRTMSLRARGS